MMQNDKKVDPQRTIVLYTSKYGAAETYARWIAEALGCRAVPLDKFSKKELQGYDTVIYGGGVQAGGIRGLEQFTKWIKGDLKLRQMAKRGTISEAEAAEAAYFVHLSHIPISTETVPLRQNLKGIVDLLNDAADVSICGHTHHFRVESPSVRVHFPVVQQGGNPDADPSRYLGAVFTLSGGHITVEKIDASGNIQERIPLS